jgi:hypothetical protein
MPENNENQLNTHTSELKGNMLNASEISEGVILGTAHMDSNKE